MALQEIIPKNGPCLDTVRALHQTVVSLRTALEQSKTEIVELKANAWSLESVANALKTLAIENHNLRQKIVESNRNKKNVKSDFQEINEIIAAQKKHVKIITSNEEDCNSKTLTSNRKISRSLDNLSVAQKPQRPTKALSVSKTVSFSNLSDLSTGKGNDMTEKNQINASPSRTIAENNNENSALPSGLMEHSQSTIRTISASNDVDQDQELDDIELIFTTDETKDSDFKGELVPIESVEGNNDQLLHCPASDFDQTLSVDMSDRELEDDVFNDMDLKHDNSQVYNSKSDNSINHEEKSLKSYYSYQDSSFENKSLEKDESFDRFEEKIKIVETDISKCGISDPEYPFGRRNTCPNPMPYRPIIHREALGRISNVRKCRPILSYSGAARRDSGAQTEISAVPTSTWRSESSLAHKVKVGENFTTLPSKFPLPGSRLRLSEKTVEARRILLSDIGFTSMVPELSRSADHLCPVNAKPPPATTYRQFLRTSDLCSPGFTSQRFTWTSTASQSEGSHTHSRYSSIYPLSPPVPARRCSAPVSPSRRVPLKPPPSRVRFANGSLPELRGDWTVSTGDSGDSTDSLVDEAENYLRRSIDCIVSGRDFVQQNETKSTRVSRRASAPEPARDSVPPQDWQPFLPRAPRDLHLDYWVKVIVPEGKVRGGRVRYVGPLVTQSDQFIGVQLSTPDGHSDGTYNNRRYFHCEPYHGIFVPFKKVVMGWKP